MLIDLTDFVNVLGQVIAKAEAKQTVHRKPRQTIFIIEECNGCDETTYEIVTFETTREKAVKTTKLLNERATPCDQCRRKNKYSFREFQEGLGEGWTSR